MIVDNIPNMTLAFANHVPMKVFKIVSSLLHLLQQYRSARIFTVLHHNLGEIW